MSNKDIHSIPGLDAQLKGVKGALRESRVTHIIDDQAAAGASDGQALAQEDAKTRAEASGLQHVW